MNKLHFVCLLVGWLDSPSPPGNPEIFSMYKLRTAYSKLIIIKLLATE